VDEIAVSTEDMVIIPQTSQTSRRRPELIVEIHWWASQGAWLRVRTLSSFMPHTLTAVLVVPMTNTL
jgi:hypothetical protein